MQLACNLAASEPEEDSKQVGGSQDCRKTQAGGGVGGKVGTKTPTMLATHLTAGRPGQQAEGVARARLRR